MPARSSSADDIAALLEELAAPDRKAALRAERALARGGAAAVELALARFAMARGAERARLVRALGRLARAAVRDGRAEPAARLRAFLLARLADEDAPSRRQAIAALGRLGGARPGEEESARVLVDALLAESERDNAPAHRRALVDALARLGDARALSAIERLAAGSDDPELGRLAREARTKLAREPARATASALEPTRASPAPVPVWLHVRRGLEPILAGELSELEPALDAPGRLRATLRGPLARLYEARTLLRAGFPLALDRAAPSRDASVAQALASDAAWQILHTFTRGPIRYRLEWATAGRKRASTLRVAQAVARARPELVNDPRESPWEAIVHERELELWPRGLEDRRFAYRRALLPAASHPTIAAALARVAGARDNEVVWDPFVGTATELIEWARLARDTEGAAPRLFGTDREPRALAAAGQNLPAAGVSATLARADARDWQPPMPLTLVLTNPPMGRRVLDQRALPELYGAVLARAAEVLVPGGRLVWLSPLPRATEQLARGAGLKLTLHLRVDMGGFWAELQRFERRR